MDTNIDEDAIDIQTLQAQIDLSMSFAQNLVSSWVKPSHKLPSRSKRNIEAELNEYMRRPSRLGVGAPIPETQNLSRETIRLKGQLIGKGVKRGREEAEKPIKDKSDDEEESRAGAIKKKAKLDAFGDGKKKKKKTKQTTDDINTHPVPTSTTEIIQTEMPKSKQLAGNIEGDTPVIVPPVPGKRHRKDPEPSTRDPTTSATPPATHSEVPNNSLTTLDPPESPKFPKLFDTSLTTTPIIASRFRRSSLSTVFLERPLLNLAPPASDSDTNEVSKVITPANPECQKKKRKRRKKKKNALASTLNGVECVTQIPS